jgi:signal transduction histidine kinase
MDSWVEIIVRLPVFGVVLIGIIVISAIFAAVVAIKKHRKNIRDLKSEIENLRHSQKEFDNLKASSDITREAYINFLYNISHEVSNPLQSIQTNLDNLVLCSPEERVRLQQYYQIISTDIHRLATLTERLRALSRLETPNRQITRESVNLKGVIETVIMSQSDYAEERGVRLTYYGPDRLTRTLANRDDLEQVFTNLIGNSIKYSKDGGGKVIITVHEEGGEFHIRVLDNGIGIPEEDLPYIFDVAYRSPETYLSRRKGTGLGLAIVKHIVDQHGGAISAQSTLGEGATFTIELPIVVPPADLIELTTEPTRVEQLESPPSPKHKSQAWLECSNGQTYQLNLGETTVGRSSNNDIQLAGNTTISRQHIKILEQDGQFTLFDIPNKGNTRVNGNIVHHTLLLKLDDDIQLGDKMHLHLVIAPSNIKQ